MSDETIDVTKELKRQERRQKREELKRKAQEFWDDNKGYILTFGPLVLAAGARVVTVLGRRHNLAIEERQKDLRVYDTSLGHYWELKRKLNNRDWTYINAERDRGASLGKILDEMRVLK